MIIIVNHSNLTPNLAGIDSVSVESQQSDPVSKAYFNIDDTGSQISLLNKQEVIICDETILLPTDGTVTPGPTPFSDNFATNDIANYTSTNNPSGSPATWTITPADTNHALSVFPANQASATLGTADQLYSISGSPSTVNTLTTVNGSTGWGEIPAQGSAAAWPSLGSIGSPSGKGFFLDASTLDGKTISGNWSGNERICDNGGTGTIVTDITVRVFKYSSGVYTGIVSWTLTSVTLPTTPATISLPSTAGTATSFATGDKLYIDFWCRIITNGGGAGKQIRQNRLSSDTTGKTGDPLIGFTTPGFTTTNQSTLSASGGAKALLLVNGFTAMQVVVSATMSISDAGGLAFNVVDHSNFYECAVFDSGSPAVTPMYAARGLGGTLVYSGNLQLYKTVAGTRSAIGALRGVFFLRGSSHTLTITTLTIGANLLITVNFDGADVLAYTDTSPLGSGQCGLRNDTVSGASSALYSAFSVTSNDFSGFLPGPSIAYAPAHNYVNNNYFNFGSGGWTTSGTLAARITFPGSGTFGTAAVATLSFSNQAVGTAQAAQNIPIYYTVIGQQLMLSCFLNITANFVNSSCFIKINFLDSSNSVISSVSQSFTANTGGATRVNITGTVPANTVTIQVAFGGVTTNTTNSGTATFTALQLEPMWFTGGNGYTTSYPTPLCDFLQPSCATVFDGTVVRFNRVFAGFVSLLSTTYNGPNRIIAVECSSLAGYLETDLLINATYSNTVDSTVITNATNSLTTHLAFLPAFVVHTAGPDFASGNQNVVIPGQTVASQQFNDATPRELLNTLSNISGYGFGVDHYSNTYYYPPMYNRAPYAFSTSPDFVNTFPVYDYELDSDGTQIKNIVRVSGGTYQVSVVEAWHAQDGSHTETVVGGKTSIAILFHNPIAVPSAVVIGGTTLSCGLDTNTGFGTSQSLCNTSWPYISLLTPISAGTSISITYTYEALAYVEVQDTASIAQYGPCYGKVNDTTLISNAACQQRGELELLLYAQPQLTLKFKTQQQLIAGQVILFTNAPDGFASAPFIVQQVTITWLGNNITQYDIQAGVYKPSLIDYIRNLYKAVNRGKVQAGAPIQTYVEFQQGDTVTFVDSVNIH